MSDLPKCLLCQGAPFKMLAHGTVIHPTDKSRPCALSGTEVTPEQWTALMGRGEPVATYDAEALAYELCLEECSEEDATRLLWEGHPPEPWGEAWQRYIPDAERMIERVKKHMTAQAPAVGGAVLRDAELYRWFKNNAANAWFGDEVISLVEAGGDRLDAAIIKAIKGEG